MSAEGPRYGTVDRDYGMRLATTPHNEDGPIWMVNLMAYREVADYDAGNASGIDPENGGTVSGREADDRYAPLDVLADIGADVVFIGDVEDQLLGDEPRWDRVGVVRYPTRRSFIEMQQREDFQKKHVHKEAGMAETIVAGCLPLKTPPLLGDSDPVDWTEVPHPPSDTDGSIMVVHVRRFRDGVGTQSPTDMETYASHAAQIAVPNGARLAGWFAVEGTIIGDGRTWDQVRFNAFPSRAAFRAVVMDPDRLSAQREHREAAIADTYTLVVRPTIDRIAESLRGETITRPTS